MLVGPIGSEKPNARREKRCGRARPKTHVDATASCCIAFVGTLQEVFTGACTIASKSDSSSSFSGSSASFVEAITAASPVK